MIKSVFDVINDLKCSGYTVVPNFLPQEAILALLDAVKIHLDKAEVGVGTSKNKDITLSMFTTTSARNVIGKVVFDQYIQSILAGFMNQPFVEHVKMLVKAPGGLDTPWHQDSAFWHEFDPSKSMISLWIALESVTTENGCLELINIKPRIQETYQHESVRNNLELKLSTQIIRKIQGEGGKSIPMVMLPGDAIIFDSTVIHRAGCNLTSRPRIGIKIVFQDYKMRSKGYPKHKTSFTLTGVRGFLNRVLPSGSTFGFV